MGLACLFLLQLSLSLLINHGSIVLVLWPFRLETVRIGGGILVLQSLSPIFIQLEIVAGILFDEQSGLSSNESALTSLVPVSYTHLRAHETPEHLVCRLLLEKKKKT